MTNEQQIDKLVEKVAVSFELAQEGVCIYLDGSYPCGKSPSVDCNVCFAKQIIPIISEESYKAGHDDGEADGYLTGYQKAREEIANDI